jgi:hypothetical protein
LALRLGITAPTTAAQLSQLDQVQNIDLKKLSAFWWSQTKLIFKNLRLQTTKLATELL